MHAEFLQQNSKNTNDNALSQSTQEYQTTSQIIYESLKIFPQEYISILKQAFQQLQATQEKQISLTSVVYNDELRQKFDAIFISEIEDSIGERVRLQQNQLRILNRRVEKNYEQVINLNNSSHSIESSKKQIQQECLSEGEEFKRSLPHFDTIDKLIKQIEEKRQKISSCKQTNLNELEKQMIMKLETKTQSSLREKEMKRIQNKKVNKILLKIKQQHEIQKNQLTIIGQSISKQKQNTKTLQNSEFQSRQISEFQDIVKKDRRKGEKERNIIVGWLILNLILSFAIFF